jgi:hypothetical protein
MSHSNLVANELKNVGFQTRVLTDNTVEVSLKYRKINTLEILYLTDELFDEIKFNARQTTTGKVILSWQSED